MTLFDKESFKKINGYSNEHWSWGGEDDDVFRRCTVMGVIKNRKNCRFKSLHHEPSVDHSSYSKIIERLNRFNEYVVDGKIIEGLSTLEYDIISGENNPSLYEKITVRI